MRQLWKTTAFPDAICHWKLKSKDRSLRNSLPLVRNDLKIPNWNREKNSLTDILWKKGDFMI